LKPTDVIDISRDKEGGRKPCDLPIASGSTYTGDGGKRLKRETTKSRVLDTGKAVVGASSII